MIGKPAVLTLAIAVVAILLTGQTGLEQPNRIVLDDQFGCVTKESYDEAINAAVRKDMRGFAYLFTSQRCLFLPRGTEVSILDQGWMGWVKLRVYVGADAFVVWANREAVYGK